MNTKGKILGTLETIAMLPALPFFLLRMLGIGVVRASIRAEVWLGRNLAYWLVVQRRIAYGKPAWQPTDWQAFGVPSPEGLCPGCASCKAEPPKIPCEICDETIQNDVALVCSNCVTKSKAKEAA